MFGYWFFRRSVGGAAAGSATAAAADKAGDDDTSDEEREWLEAVESGDIEQYEKKKAERNPANLTARQVGVR